MKRYIKSSTDQERFQRGIRQLRKDMKLLNSCDSIRDLEDNLDNFEFKFYTSEVIEKLIAQGAGFEDIIDEVQDNLIQQIKYLKQEIVKQDDYDAEAKIVEQQISSLSNKYDMIAYEAQRFLFNAPEGANHDDCILFVDDVANVTNAEYNGTGRGGSWTAWDLKTESGVRIKAGHYKGSDDTWFVSIR